MRENRALVGVRVQVSPGAFLSPGVNDIIPVSVPDNGSDIVSANDPTLTGSIFTQPRVYLGLTGRAGATAPLRGPGGSAPPTAGAWPIGRVLMAAGLNEFRNGTAIAGVLQAGSTTTALVLANAASSVDDFYVGVPIQTALIGSGFRQTSMIMDYVGSSRTAHLPQTMGGAPAAGVAYNIPACLSYILGTGDALPLMSVSVWRDKVRYDYVDCAIQSLGINIPVANEQNTELPAIEFSFKGTPIPVADATMPTMDPSILLPIPPARAGTFAFDKTKLGHNSLRFDLGAETSAAPNQNMDSGQEQQELTSASRSIALDLNAVEVATFDLHSRVDGQTRVPLFSSWGLGMGNRFGFLTPSNLLDPFNPAGRNGLVSVAGSAFPDMPDKSVALSVWWE